MGLQDRDYMRERRRGDLDRLLKDADRPFRPPSAGRSFIVPLITWICIGFVLFKAFGWWEQHRRTQRVPTSRPLVQEQGERRSTPAPAPSARTESIQRNLASRIPSAPPPEPEARAAPRTGGTIYLCRDYGGGTFWASDHCNQHQALIVRIMSVPPGMPFEQQAELAQQRRAELDAAAQPSVQAVAAPSLAASNKLACQSLDQRVNHLDALARQPQSGQMQDWIRSERQKARDEQFRLHC
jgi:hypothetical protein